MASPNELQRAVIGIAGGTASGKTRLAHELVTSSAQHLALLCQDAYYRSPGLPLGNFDDPDAIDWTLLERHVSCMIHGQGIEAPIYDFATHTRSTSQTLATEPAPVLIVEGLHVLHRQVLRQRLTLAIYVDAPADIRLLRRIRRDVSSRGRTVDEVLQQYERHVRPMHERHVEPSRRFADLVLDGTRSPSDNVALIQAVARKHAVLL